MGEKEGSVAEREAEKTERESQRDIIIKIESE